MLRCGNDIYLDKKLYRNSDPCLTFSFNWLLQVEKVELPFDKQKDQRRAFVFVEFDSEEAVKKVLDETSHKLGTQEVGFNLFA